MVCNVLHVICGNCGSTDLFYERDDDIYFEEGFVVDHTNLKCDNCGTIHILNVLVKKKEKIK